jgi:hypothetical protein
MFISGPPSSRAHFPYQAGLHSNSSLLDPLSLSTRTTCEPPHHHPGRCHRLGRCLGLCPDVRLTGQPVPPLLLRHVPHPTPALPPLPSYARRAQVCARCRHNTGPSLSSRLQPSRPPFPSAEWGHHLATSLSTATRAVPMAVLEQLGRAELAAPCFSVGCCSGEAPALSLVAPGDPKTELSHATPPRGGCHWRRQSQHQGGPN